MSPFKHVTKMCVLRTTLQDNQVHACAHYVGPGTRGFGRFGARPNFGDSRVRTLTEVGNEHEFETLSSNSFDFWQGHFWPLR